MAIFAEKSFTKAYARLLAESKRKQRYPQGDSPSRLPLNTIWQYPTLFQPRMGLEDSVASQAQIKVLKNSISDSQAKEIEAVTVWWSGKYWYLIDGHHRLKAYEDVFKEKGWRGDREIPVTVLEGDLTEAIEASIKLNSRNKLNMQKNDKLNQAWRCVVLGEWSKNQIASICGVGTSTVARMRGRLLELKALRERSPMFNQKDLSDMTWGEAQRDPSAIKTHDEDWKERQAKGIGKRLDKAFGMAFVDQPEIFFMGIEHHSPVLAEGLREWLLSSDEDNDEEEETKEENDF